MLLFSCPSGIKPIDGGEGGPGLEKRQLAGWVWLEVGSAALKRHPRYKTYKHKCKQISFFRIFYLFFTKPVKEKCVCISMCMCMYVHVHCVCGTDANAHDRGPDFGARVAGAEGC